MKKLIVSLIISLFIISCASPDKVIKPDKDTGDSKLTCVQSLLHDHEIFKQEFKFNNEVPEMIIYAKGAYASLSDDEKESVLASFGTQWQSCYPDDFRPLTLWLHDENESMLNVMFIIKE